MFNTHMCRTQNMHMIRSVSDTIVTSFRSNQYDEDSLSNPNFFFRGSNSNFKKHAGKGNIMQWQELT
jgi:hypothetical protein